MKRRNFLKQTALTAAAAATTKLSSATTASGNPIARRPLGKTGEHLSIIGFGGIVVMNEETGAASDIVAEAVDRGINYFDVAPSYGNAQERLGPALAPYFRSSVSLPPAIQATRRLTSTLMGFVPTEDASLRWTHRCT
jgi:hypothetical protein